MHLRPGKPSWAIDPEVVWLPCFVHTVQRKQILALVVQLAWDWGDTS